MTTEVGLVVAKQAQVGLDVDHEQDQDGPERHVH
jgi:hypothetical protein